MQATLKRGAMIGQVRSLVVALGLGAGLVTGALAYSAINDGVDTTGAEVIVRDAPEIHRPTDRPWRHDGGQPADTTHPLTHRPTDRGPGR